MLYGTCLAASKCRSRRIVIPPRPAFTFPLPLPIRPFVYIVSTCGVSCSPTHLFQGRCSSFSLFSQFSERLHVEKQGWASALEINIASLDPQECATSVIQFSPSSPGLLLGLQNHHGFRRWIACACGSYYLPCSGCSSISSPASIQRTAIEWLHTIPYVQGKYVRPSRRVLQGLDRQIWLAASKDACNYRAYLTFHRLNLPYWSKHAVD